MNSDVAAAVAAAVVVRWSSLRRPDAALDSSRCHCRCRSHSWWPSSHHSGTSLVRHPQPTPAPTFVSATTIIQMKTTRTLATTTITGPPACLPPHATRGSQPRLEIHTGDSSYSSPSHPEPSSPHRAHAYLQHAYRNSSENPPNAYLATHQRIPDIPCSKFHKSHPCELVHMYTPQARASRLHKYMKLQSMQRRATKGIYIPIQRQSTPSSI